MENKTKSSKIIRKGVKIIGIAGNSRGLTGIVQSRKGDKVTIKGLNICKKHLKKTGDNPSGRIVEIERPIHVSNLKVFVEPQANGKLKEHTNE